MFVKVMDSDTVGEFIVGQGCQVCRSGSEGAVCK